MTVMNAVVPLVALLLGLAVGSALGVLVTRSRVAGLAAELAAERRNAAERTAYVEQTQQRLAEQFSALSAEALDQNNRRFLDLADARLKEAGTRATGELEQRRQAVEQVVGPLRDSLAELSTKLGEMENARIASYHKLTEQVGSLGETSAKLRDETSALVTALKAPQARGRWGELHLRRCVEMAGMVEYCDFVEQATAATEDGSVRPDLVIRLSGSKNVVVDAKVSLAAYLEAAQSQDADVSLDRLRAHARSLRRHVDDLGGKRYWSAFSPAPEFVVLFVPGEAFLAPALEHDPALLEHAMGKRVVIATPTTLVTMLRTVAYSWQQTALTENAQKVFDLGRTLYERLSKLGDHVDKLGRSINRVVGDYNNAVGSLESRVLVTARQLSELKVVDQPLDAPGPVEQTAKVLTSNELLVSAEEGRQLRIVAGDDGYDNTCQQLGEDPDQGSGARAGSGTS